MGLALLFAVLLLSACLLYACSCEEVSIEGARHDDVDKGVMLA